MGIKNKILIFILSVSFLYSSNIMATVDDCPNVADGQGHSKYSQVFSNFQLFIDPVTFNGDPFIDWETIQSFKDQTTGTNANPTGNEDISSGCTTAGSATCPDNVPPGGGNCNPNYLELNPQGIQTHTCGQDPSAWFGFFDPDLNTTWDPTDNDPAAVTGCDSGGAGNGNEFILLRLRLNGSPRTNQAKRFDFQNSYWHFLFDIPISTSPNTRSADGWNDFFVEVNGQATLNNADTIRIFFNNGVNVSSQICNTAPGGTCFVRQFFSACSNIPQCTTDDGTLDGIQDCTRSYTRVTPTTNSQGGGTEYFLDAQLPISYFTDQNGVPILNCSSNIRMFLSTSTTAQNPFLKDSLPGCTNTTSCSGGETVPITLSYFSAESYGNQVLINWSTGTETANAGFNLY